jgi:hypothetical protein
VRPPRRGSRDPKPRESVSDQLDRAGRAVESVDGGAEAAAEDAAGGDGEFDGKLQEVGVEQHLMAVDAADGVAVERSPFCVGAN